MTEILTLGTRAEISAYVNPSVPDEAFAESNDRREPTV